jgi:hypothetical protein
MMRGFLLLFPSLKARPRRATKPRATVRATARSLSKSKSRRIASPAFDLVQAGNRWQAACAAYDAASGRYAALCNEMESVGRAAAAKHSKRLAAVYDEEAKLAEIMDKRDGAASAILAAPESIDALQLKLDLFRHLWAKERGIEQPRDGGDVADVAAGIVLDLLTILHRGQAAELCKAA